MSNHTPTPKELNEWCSLPSDINNIVSEYIGNPMIFTVDTNHNVSLRQDTRILLDSIRSKKWLYY